MKTKKLKALGIALAISAITIIPAFAGTIISTTNDKCPYCSGHNYNVLSKDSEIIFDGDCPDHKNCRLALQEVTLHNHCNACDKDFNGTQVWDYHFNRN